MESPHYEDIRQLKKDIYGKDGIITRMATLEERVEAIKSIDRKLWGIMILVIVELLKSLVMK